VDIFPKVWVSCFLGNSAVHLLCMRASLRGGKYQSIHGGYLFSPFFSPILHLKVSSIEGRTIFIPTSLSMVRTRPSISLYCLSK
jgi:hypothetical protein